MNPTMPVRSDAPLAKILSLALLLLVLPIWGGCTTPTVKRLPEQRSASGLLASIQDGVTTRQELILRLGTPSTQFEGQRILTYQVRMDKGGEWQIFWPRRLSQHSWLGHWESGVYSLVLVFNSDGILVKHSLVGAE